MRLFNSSIVRRNILILFFIVFVAGCTSSQTTQSLMTITITSEGDQKQLSLPVGDTVQQALDEAGITLEYLDRAEPPAFTKLTDGDNIKVVRVREEFFVEEEVIPFERQMLQTESLPDQETLLAQSGVNGVREITYRQVFEDGVEVSRFPVKSSILKDAVPEIIMVGIQTPFVPIAIPGRIAYLLAGNAWIMDQTTGNRKAVVTTGDLDGHIFTLDRDGSRLLFTRKSEVEGQINSLWVADLNKDPIALYDLKVSNVVHFADWLPDPKNDKVAFSTVEPRPTAPGWQANNDLNVISFSPSGWVSQWKIYVDANSGGVYGWWGTNYILEPGGDRVAYARPDGIGLVNMEDGSLTPLMETIPVQTGGDWAWVPGFSWSPDKMAAFTVNHTASTGPESPEESPLFDLTAILLDIGNRATIMPQTGMFSYPRTSPEILNSDGEKGYLVAYLQSIFPNQSESSRYRLVVMDQDGSNPKILYPAEGESGIEPQEVSWSPAPLPRTENYAIALINQGNLWLVDSLGLEDPKQVTGDGLVTRIDWK